MTENYPTARRELAEILNTLARRHKRTLPEGTLLFSNPEATRTPTEVAEEVTAGSYIETKLFEFQGYLFHLPLETKDAGKLVVEQRRGEIDFEYVFNGKRCRFGMRIGYGGRVEDYGLERTDNPLEKFNGNQVHGLGFRMGTEKKDVISALENLF